MRTKVLAGEGGQSSHSMRSLQSIKLACEVEETSPRSLGLLGMNDYQSYLHVCVSCNCNDCMHASHDSPQVGFNHPKLQTIQHARIHDKETS